MAERKHDPGAVTSTDKGQETEVIYMYVTQQIQEKGLLVPKPHGHCPSGKAAASL